MKYKSVQDLKVGDKYYLHSWYLEPTVLKEKRPDFSGYRLINTNGAVYCNINPEFMVLLK